MFSTLHKQKEAEELIEEARRIVEESDHACELAHERVQKSVADADNLRNRLSKKSLKLFHDLFFKIKGVEPVEMADVAERPYASQLEELSERIEEIEPVEIAGAKQGKASAVAASFAAALVTVAAALITALVATGTPLDPKTLSQPQTIENLLTWIGGGAFGYPAASPVLGGLGIAAGAAAAALIVWSILMAKSSGRNLAVAKTSHADAMNYRDRKMFYTEAMERLEERMQNYLKILETFDIFMQEYNAVIRRILYTEGREFEKYKESSQERIERAARCAEAIVPILNITIVTSEGTPSEQLEEAIELGSAFREALMNEEPLPKEGQKSSTLSAVERPNTPISDSSPHNDEDLPLAIESGPTR